jgi:hypothetical protein
LSDGTHTVEVGAVDPAGNEVKSPAQTVVVDNGAPAVPQSLTVEGGDGWRADNSFSLSWTNPSDPGSPVAGVHYALCAEDGSDCQPSQQLTGTGISRLESISVPWTGAWTVRLWLEDAAGNVDSAHFATATLRYATPPAAVPPQVDPPAMPTDPSSAPPPADPTTPFVSPLPAPRRDVGLRLTTARFSHSHSRLLIRGRTLPGATIRLTLTLRPKHGTAVRRTVAVRGGPFTLTFKHALRGSVTARFAGTVLFRPASATITTRG